MRNIILLRRQFLLGYADHRSQNRPPFPCGRSPPCRRLIRVILDQGLHLLIHCFQFLRIQPNRLSGLAMGSKPSACPFRTVLKIDTRKRRERIKSSCSLTYTCRKGWQPLTSSAESSQVGRRLRMIRSVVSIHLLRSQPNRRLISNTLRPGFLEIIVVVLKALPSA